MAEKWSVEHKRMLSSELSNEMISKITGRPISAVRCTRYNYTGYSTSQDRATLTRPERLSKVEGECRILEMCKKLNVRLSGCNYKEEQK